jgi:hypothetical protein
MGKLEEGKGFITSSYSITPKAFHSPNSLNLGWFSSKTILVTLTACIKLACCWAKFVLKLLPKNYLSFDLKLKIRIEPLFTPF